MRFTSLTAIGAILALIALAGCGTDNPISTDVPIHSGSVPLGTASNEDGVSLVANGVGLMPGSGSFSLNVPVASSADILEAAFYWNGRSPNPAGDPDIVINGTNHSATLVTSFLISQRYAFFYKLDALGMVVPGNNTFNVSGFDMGPDGLPNGIGLAVIYRDPTSDYTVIQTMDLGEYFYYQQPGFENGDVHNFAFDPEDVAREGELMIMVGDCQPTRSDAIWFETGPGSSAPANLIGGPHPHVNNVLVAAQGDAWDIYQRSDLMIPANAGHFAFQIESPMAGNGDSGLVSFAAFCVPDIPPPPPPAGCFWTIGFWKHQINVAVGDRNGHQHLSDQELTDLLALVYTVTQIGYDEDGNGVISFREADNFLDLHGNVSMCDRARQQFLATLLNYAYNGLDGSIMVDTNYDGQPDMRLDDAAEMIEEKIQTGDCHSAKDMADSINNMPECDP
jgi:hypothetical protein